MSVKKAVKLLSVSAVLVLGAVLLAKKARDRALTIHLERYMAELKHHPKWGPHLEAALTGEMTEDLSEEISELLRKLNPRHQEEEEE